MGNEFLKQLKTNQAEKASVVFKEINPTLFDLNFKKEVLEVYNELKSYEN